MCGGSSPPPVVRTDPEADQKKAEAEAKAKAEADLAARRKRRKASSLSTGAGLSDSALLRGANAAAGSSQYSPGAGATRLGG